MQMMEEQLFTVIKGDNKCDYQKFNLRHSEDTVFSYLEDCAIHGIARDGYFIIDSNLFYEKNLKIVLDGYCYTIPKSICKFISCDLLEKHQLSIGYIDNFASVISSGEQHFARIAEFKNKIIDAQLTCSKDFLRTIYFYLKNRQSENQMLINKEIIQIMLGDVIIHFKSALQHREQAIHSSKKICAENQSSAMLEIKKANHILAKLYGGRSFLSENIIEMIMIFEYFRSIYFD